MLAGLVAHALGENHLPVPQLQCSRIAASVDRLKSTPKIKS
jgi:hypothetical protein